MVMIHFLQDDSEASSIRGCGEGKPNGGKCGLLSIIEEGRMVHVYLIGIDGILIRSIIEMVHSSDSKSLPTPLS